METEVRKEPAIADIDSAPVTLPQPGDVFEAEVVRLGMTNAGEIFGEKAENPSQQILVVFFQAENGLMGKTTLGFYKVPSPRAKLYNFVKRYGQPKVGMTVKITRDDKGYWGIEL